MISKNLPSEFSFTTTPVTVASSPKKERNTIENGRRAPGPSVAPQVPVDGGAGVSFADGSNSVQEVSWLPIQEKCWGDW